MEASEVSFFLLLRLGWGEVSEARLAIMRLAALLEGAFALVFFVLVVVVVLRRGLLEGEEGVGV